jgi:tRNA(Ile)-lysidine synthase
MLFVTNLSDYRLFDSPNHEVSHVKYPISDLRLIRPLLDVTRSEIETYCDTYGLEPRFDRSNLDTTYFRNWLRQEVLPLLASHNPNIREVLRRSAHVIADDYDLFRSLLEETWQRVVVEEPSPAAILSPDEAKERRIVLDLEAWRALPRSLQRSTLREAIHRLRRSLRNINFVHVENALLVARDGTTGDRATLPQGLLLSVGYDRLTIADGGASERLPNWPLLLLKSAPLAVEIPGTTPLPESNWMVEVEVLARADLPTGWEVNTQLWHAFVDAQAAEGPLWLRTRQAGDRFEPLGLGGHSVSLADFLTNQKVPRAARDRWPLLTGPKGIVWVCGQRIDERVRVTDQTEEVLALRFVAGMAWPEG